MSAIGLRVGPFEIQDEVDVPGAGAWYHATRTGLTRRKPSEVLVRLLGPAPTTRELAAAQRQFDVLRAVDDARFPRAVALYEGSGALAVQAPLGVGLDRLVEARLLGDVTMTPATLLDLALELTEALAHAHGCGYHHGHLSPSSITLSADGELVVWGLGASDARPAFSWLPPERARGEAASALTDQWSLGAIIVSLVTGRTPWSAGSADADPRSGTVDAFLEPLARQWPALGRLVRRAMDPNPALRFPSLHPVRLELLALARRAGGTSDRRAVASWLHQESLASAEVPEEDEAAPVQVAMGEADEDSIETVEPANIRVSTPTADPEAPEAPKVAAPTLRVRAEPAVDPADLPPSIQSASRRPGPDGRSQRLRQVRGALPAEAMAVVHPDADPDEVPEVSVAASPPRRSGRGRASISLPAVDGTVRPTPPPDETPTEMAELDPGDMVTEMATEMLEDADPMVEVPPVRPRAAVFRVELTDESLAGLPGEGSGPEAPADDAPAELTPGPEPSYRGDPVPTLPGMEVPEPSADRPVVQVSAELEDDDAEDAAPDAGADKARAPAAVLAEHEQEAPDSDTPAPETRRPVTQTPTFRMQATSVEVEIEEDDDLAVDDPVSDASGSVVDGRVMVPVQVSFDDDEDEISVEIDVPPDELPRRAAPTVVPFTDPHFAGPSLGLEGRGARDGDGPSLGLSARHEHDDDEDDDVPVIRATARWPWEQDPNPEPGTPYADPLVQLAPYVASVTVASLALLFLAKLVL